MPEMIYDDPENLAILSPTHRIDYIVVHHSLTKDGAVVDAAAIRKYHMQVNGWSDIGYHFLVEKVNDEFKIVEGRSLLKPGAHCKDGGFNHKSIGVCVVGNWDNEAPPAPQWNLACRLVYKLAQTFYVPFNRIIGHREAQALSGVPEWMRKSCPGKAFDMTKFRQDVGGSRAVV